MKNVKSHIYDTLPYNLPHHLKVKRSKIKVVKSRKSQKRTVSSLMDLNVITLLIDTVGKIYINIIL